MASLSDSNGRRQGVERGSLDDSTWREQDFREMKVGRVLLFVGKKIQGGSGLENNVYTDMHSYGIILDKS